MQQLRAFSTVRDIQTWIHLRLWHKALGGSASLVLQESTILFLSISQVLMLLSAECRTLAMSRNLRLLLQSTTMHTIIQTLALRTHSTQKSNQWIRQRFPLTTRQSMGLGYPLLVQLFVTHLFKHSNTQDHCLTITKLYRIHTMTTTSSLSGAHCSTLLLFIHLLCTKQNLLQHQ
mmetsp:Transcript_333/g.1198  ORF Transcript_333/g.1198 Transcript_333/m.1198 type:complete len:175 (+) Transcript_333:1001-1525(+)